MRPITWLLLLLTAAGCGESTGPLADLSELRTSLAVVNTVFASPLVRSLGYFQLVPPLPTPAADHIAPAARRRCRVPGSHRPPRRPARAPPRPRRRLLRLRVAARSIARGLAAGSSIAAGGGWRAAHS